MFVRRSVLAGLVVAAAMFAQAPPTPRASRGRLVMTQSSRRGYLGVGVVELTAERARALKLADQAGMEVKRVDGNSPAAKAGLQEGDVLLEVNGKKADDVEEFIRTIGEADPGAKVNLTVWRDGAKHSLTATLQARPLQAFLMPEADLPPMPPMPETPN